MEAPAVLAPTASASRAEIEIAERGDVLVGADRAEAVRVEVDRPQAGGERTLDVEPDAIPDVDGALSRRPRGLKGRVEDAGVGFLGADRPGVDDGGDGRAWAGPDLAHARLAQVPLHPPLRVRHDRDAAPGPGDGPQAATDSGTTVVQDGAPAPKTLASPSTRSPGSGEKPRAARYAAR